MITLSLLETNWQSIKTELISLFKTTACKREFVKLKRAANFRGLFTVIWTNYDWLRRHNCAIAELENLTPEITSGYAAQILQTYCLGYGVDQDVEPIIKLHRRRANGENPTPDEWDAASRRAWHSARHSSGAARESARAAAQSTRTQPADAIFALHASIVRAIWDEARLESRERPMGYWTGSRASRQKSRLQEREILRHSAAIISQRANSARETLTDSLIQTLYSTHE